MSQTARAWPRPEIRPGSVLVTGSSGKGTTCRILAEVLRAAGLHPMLAAERTRPWPGVTRRGSIWLVEADAAALVRLVRRGNYPTAVLCTNILRGRPGDNAAGAALTAQLERVIRSLPPSTTLILNADDPRVASLAASRPNPRLYFGMSDPVHGRVRRDPTAEIPACPRCGERLSYARVYYAHLGHWGCGACGLGRPEPDVSVTKIGLVGSSSSRLQFGATTARTTLEVPLPGMYNAYNALAAVTTATHLGLPAWSLRAIENASGGPMRMERARVAGHDVYLAVAENATGYTEVLRAILGDGEPRRMLLGLSVSRRLHHDISWIWDVDFESLAGLVPGPIVCGNRAADLGVRLEYAGWLGARRVQGHAADATIEPDPIRAVRMAIAATPPGQPLWIVSTSVALAEIRTWLRERDRVPHSVTGRGGRSRSYRPAPVQAEGAAG
jgi:UDP-N-acetylmuramyl tripeptide synthase